MLASVTDRLRQIKVDHFKAQKNQIEGNNTNTENCLAFEHKTLRSNANLSVLNLNIVPN